ncbi:MAG: hypothetical protein Q8M15_04785, partial [Bacteroidota bacterium]|nr:hypothetical protein [Bacteroidota bacterium]
MNRLFLQKCVSLCFDLGKKLKTTIVLLLFSFMSFGQTPMFYNSTYVGGANSIPFNPNISTTFQRAQFVWNPASFPGSFSGNITKVYFYATSTTSSVFTNCIIGLATSISNPISASAWFPTTTVVNSPSYTINTTTNGWCQLILTTPFYYDNTKYLIIDFSSSGTSAGGFAINQQPIAALNPGRSYGMQASSTPSGADGNTPDFGIDIVPATGGVNILPPIANFFPSQATTSSVPSDTVWINSPYNLVSTSTNTTRSYW